MSAATQLAKLLGLSKNPVAIAFRGSPPASMDRIDKVAPSGCTYWELASEGRTFYTDAADHYGCPIGSYTHGINLPPDKSKELEGLIGTMVELNYIDPSEVSGIPRRQQPFGVAM